jgi:hypothetical protein
VVGAAVTFSGRGDLAMRSYALVVIWLWLAIDIWAWLLPLEDKGIPFDCHGKPRMGFKYAIGGAFTSALLLLVGMNMWWWMDGKLKDQQDEVFQQLEIQARAPGNGKLYDALFVLTNKSSFDVERHALQCLSVHERYENNVSFGMTRRLFLLDRMLIKAIIYLRNTRKASILALRGGGL